MPIDPGTRVAQSDDAIREFESELATWFAAIANKDALRKYVTQLDDLRNLLNEGNARLHQAARDVPQNLPYGDTCRRCREIDRGLALARTVWHYFRSKYDQRDDKHLASVLEAADEIAWSSYSLPFRVLDRKIASSPLPYIAPIDAPAAVPRIDPPPEFRNASGALTEWLRKLPIPVVALPASSVYEPWRLVFLGHEIGHHVLIDLVSDWSLHVRFNDLLAEAVGDVSSRWKEWGCEIFADVWGLLTLGPWSIWALAEAEMDEEAGMLRAKTGGKAKYPPPVVRLRLLEHLAEALGVPFAKRLGADYGLDVEALATGPPVFDPKTHRDLRQEAADEMARVPAVARAILETDLGESLGTLVSLADWSRCRDGFQPGGAVEVWSSEWCNGVPQPSVPTKSWTARQLAASAVGAWANAVVGTDSARAALRRNLAERYSETIVAAREDGVRADVIASDREVTGLGTQLILMALEGGPESPPE